jgi:bifunctional NMN adenylyltransferase/nudix hydrolase
MSKLYEYVVFIGRFQPFHNGHKQVIETALNMADKVIILVGSAFQPRTPKNPWTYRERAEMITASLGELSSRVIIQPLLDQRYNDQKWATSVQEVVQKSLRGWSDYPPRVAIIGHTKDDSSYYLKLFPQWSLVEHDMNESVNATDLRDLYLEGKNVKFLQSLVPVEVFGFLQNFKLTAEYKILVDEHEHLKKYKKAWEVAPYAPTFVTADAVVIQSGHVLLIQRGAAPGKGLLALPGGFLDQNETMEDGALRELREETKLKVPLPVLRGNIKASKVFDAPNRSLRGRTITNAFLIELPAGPLPSVKGGMTKIDGRDEKNDTKKAFWKPINEVRSDEMFEDHYDIIQYFLGLV